MTSEYEAAERLCAEALRAVNDSITEAREQIRRIEAAVADLDDATPSRRAFEELHTRVDALEARP